MDNELARSLPRLPNAPERILKMLSGLVFVARVGHEVPGMPPKFHFTRELVLSLVPKLVSVHGHFGGILCHLAGFVGAKSGNKKPL